MYIFQHMIIEQKLSHMFGIFIDNIVKWIPQFLKQIVLLVCSFSRYAPDIHTYKRSYLGSNIRHYLLHLNTAHRRIIHSEKSLKIFYRKEDYQWKLCHLHHSSRRLFS